MKKQDRSTKVLLGLLVAGVWGLLLKPMISPTPVVAQATKKRAPQYALAIRYDEIGRGLGIKPLGTNTNTTKYKAWIWQHELEEALELGYSKGWRVHTMTPAGNGTAILFQK